MTSASATRARIAVTLGDPRGIGAEVVRKALLDARVQAACTLVLVGPSGLEIKASEVVGSWRPGDTADTAGRLAGQAIERAVAMVVAGTVQGLVTAPIDKAALHAAGFDYPGHTEMLAALSGSRTAMMLASDRLRVVLATTHIALRDVPGAVTADAIAGAARLTRAGLQRWFGISEPRLALCALNPHGGDGGRFGDEDTRVLAPVARAERLAGPLAADTVFVRAMRGEFDAVIAPYHDVGMTAIKVASFGHAVNVTLGLPFPRTSPDHGTAMDIAGRDVADPSSMIQALLMCASIVSRIRAGESRTVR